MLLIYADRLYTFSCICEQFSQIFIKEQEIIVGNDLSESAIKYLLIIRMRYISFFGM